MDADVALAAVEDADDAAGTTLLAGAAAALLVPVFDVEYGPGAKTGMDSTSLVSFLPPNSITFHCAARFASPSGVPFGALFGFTV